MEDLLQNVDAVFVQFDKDEAELTSLHRDLSQLVDSTIAIESFGINPTALAVLQTTGLLAGTSLNAIAVENFSFTGERAFNDHIAVESLMDNIKEKAARWSAKILSVAKEGGQKLLSVLSPLMDKASEMIKALATKAWDKIKDAGVVVKAHPFKTVMAVVGTMAAVATLMAYCGSSLPGGNATKETLAAFFTKVNDQINKLPWPFGKVKSTLGTAYDFRIDVVYPSKVAATSVESLGWTAAAVKQLGGQLDRVWSAIKVGIGAVGARVMKVTSDIGSKTLGAALTATSKVGHAAVGGVVNIKNATPKFVYSMTGSRDAAHATSFAIGGIFYGLCISLVYALWRLVRAIVVGGFGVIIGTARILTGSDPRF